jgi:hypothetical protein
MDIYDGADWTETDIEDLISEIRSGRSVEEVAQFLCRADNVDDVARKCEELGLKPKARAKAECAMTADQQLILDAVDKAQRILADYIEPGPRNPEGTIEELREALARPQLIGAVQRVRAGYGLRVVR